MVENLTLETFEPHVGSGWRIVVDAAHAVDAQLVAAEALPASARGGSREPFRLLVDGPLTPVLPQRIYRLEHAALPPLDLFLVPIGPHEGRMRYEVIFT